MTGYEIPTVAMRPPRFKKDKSVTLSFDTGEMNTQQKTQLLDSDGMLGTLIFVPEGAQDSPPKIDSEFEGKKPSQRLYNTMFVYWKQQGAKGDFEVYYRDTMEKIINSYKDKLDSF